MEPDSYIFEKTYTFDFGLIAATSKFLGIGNIFFKPRDIAKISSLTYLIRATDRRHSKNEFFGTQNVFFFFSEKCYICFLLTTSFSLCYIYKKRNLKNRAILME